MGLSALLRESAAGDVVVERHGTPVAAIVSTERLDQINQAHQDVLDAALVLARAAGDSRPQVTLSDALQLFGLDRDELLAENE